MKFKWIPLGFLTVLAVSSLGFREQPPARPGGPINLGDTAWLLTASGLVLLMTPGLSFFYAGMVSTKNVISTMLQSFIALGVITLVWVIVGFSLCFGTSLNGLIGDPRTYGRPRPEPARGVHGVGADAPVRLLRVNGIDGLEILRGGPSVWPPQRKGQRSGRPLAGGCHDEAAARTDRIPRSVRSGRSVDRPRTQEGRARRDGAVPRVLLPDA